MSARRIHLTLHKYVDGEPCVEELESPDRWSVHESHTVEVHIYGDTVRIIQKPHALRGNKIGVGAALWDGALILAAYLGTLPRYHFIGLKAVELGAGVGLVGLLAAKYGARTTLTDIDRVVPLLAENAEANGYPQEKAPPEGKGWAAVRELEWGKEGYEDVVATLAPADLVLAADCCYIDGDGPTPSTEHFVRAARGLTAPMGVFYCASEIRSSEIREDMVRLLGQHFSRVSKPSLLELPSAFRIEHIELFECRP